MVADLPTRELRGLFGSEKTVEHSLGLLRREKDLFVTHDFSSVNALGADLAARMFSGQPSVGQGSRVALQFFNPGCQIHQYAKVLAAHAESPRWLPAVWRFREPLLFPPMSKTMISVGFDRRQAARAWEVALRLKEQGNRLGVPHGITQSLPESALALEMLEGQIQVAAKRLANATGVTATSLENLIDELERYGTGGTYLRRWQH